MSIRMAIVLSAILTLTAGSSSPASAESDCASSAAQMAEIPRHVVQQTWNSGVLDSRNARSTVMAASDWITVANAPWLQLQFTNTSLGRNSHIVLTSMQDGATQRLDATQLARTNGRSAFFNGDSVQVEVVLAPGDAAVSVNVGSVVAGLRANAGPGRQGAPVPMSICGVDNRIASTEPRVARIDPIGCTAWTIQNGLILTAGHCLAGGSSNQVISFNPPASLPDGTVQFPGPEDQYTIDQSSFDFVNGGVGNDWGVFEVFNNAQTGAQPIDRQGAFNIRQDRSPSTIRITGFGVDSGTTNQTNQTHAGSNTGSTGTTMRYNADTTGGNSGSPVIDEATGESVGIHSHGGCTSGGGNNSGTSFFNSALWNAVNTTPPPPPPPLNCPAGAINFSNFGLTSYSNQNASNGTNVENGGDSLRLTGNTWVRSTQSFTVTPNTVIDFEFASSDQGEIHAIGFDNNDSLNDAPRHFQFWGTQNWTGTGKIDLTPKYSGGGAFQSYSVPVGASYTGTMNLVFTNDDDASASAEAVFACVVVREASNGGGGCDVTQDFESGNGGWTTSGSCTTGTFVVGTPDEVVNGGVTTQVNGASSGSQALFTQPNTGGAGSDDVDGGECIATSPVYNVTADSTITLDYFHGQRDAGDDSNDGFALEMSINGRAYTTLVSLGDVTSNAAWTSISANASAGDTVRLRVRASDAASAGDLIEAGVDNIEICAN